MQTLQYAPVPSHLQPYLGMVYSGIAEPGPTPLPAMMAQLWVCTFPVYWTAPGSLQLQRLPAVTVMGPVMGANVVHVPERGLIMGLGFWPRGWAELVRVSAAELMDVAIDGTALWPARSARLLDEIQEARDWAAQAEVLVAFAQELLGVAKVSRDAALITAIDAWLASREPVEVLAHQLGYSLRQIERIAGRTHGGSPRLLASRQRALRTAAHLVKGSLNRQQLWSEYADQSHFIREFRRFIGGTPSSFGQESQIGHSMFSKSWESDADHPLAYGAHVGTRYEQVWPEGPGV